MIQIGSQMVFRRRHPVATRGKASGKSQERVAVARAAALAVVAIPVLVVGSGLCRALLERQIRRDALLSDGLMSTGCLIHEIQALIFGHYWFIKVVLQY